MSHGPELPRTAGGWVYADFLLDEFSRLVVGWPAATGLCDLALDSLQMSIWRRQADGADEIRVVQGDPDEVRFVALYRSGAETNPTTTL
ncbi:hypothetical protein [Amycolatopsis sp. NPDC051372]|uniref:hypothetical protein n=1 Tax=unclassified Amycolatopsis TaxID=2618356 RepID=UPI00343953CA